MLSVTMDAEHQIAILEPSGQLTEQDFETAARTVDPWIEKYGHLNGILIHIENFPGWDSFAALCAHLRFVRQHHQKVTRVALVTDAYVGKLIESLASHFVRAEISVFPYQDIDQAKRWLSEPSDRYNQSIS